MRRSIAAAFVALIASIGCSERRASEAECRAILERIVEIELSEMGFDDPILAERWKRETAARYAPALAECVGRPLPPGAAACIARAKTTEALSHECLR